MPDKPLYLYLLKDILVTHRVIIICVDPDGLLTDERVIQKLKGADFIILRYENPITFRFLYEKEYRQNRNNAKNTKCIILFPNEDSDIKQIPFDILSLAKVFKFNLRSLFPNLDYRAVAALSWESVSELFTITQYPKNSLGHHQSIDFILKNLFWINPSAIKQPKDLLRSLLFVHGSFKVLPGMYAEYLRKQLNSQALFRSLPLKSLYGDRTFFLEALQDGWKLFIDHLDDNKVSEEDWLFDLFLFEDYEIRPLIIQYFQAGKLEVVTSELAINEAPSWYHIGLVEKDQLLSQKCTRIKSKIQNTLKLPDHINYEGWGEIAKAWAELKQILLGMDDKNSTAYDELEKLIDVEFKKWLKIKFDMLLTLPPIPPKVVHQIPDFLQRQIRGNRNNKVALIVLDGMAFWQWLVVKQHLQKQDANLLFDEQAVFAWIPTITSISRQAIFAGTMPNFYESSLSTTNKEESLWKTLWETIKFPSEQIQYFRNAENKQIFDLLNPNNRILGIVINAMDDIMHGMTLGEKGMLTQVQQWIETSNFYNILRRLLNQGYRVFLTADHGNVETKETISISDGIMAETRGERVRIYSDESLVPEAHHTWKWTSSGLPETLTIILAEDGFSFKREQGPVIVHGGASLQEVIVPFVEVGYKNE